MWRLIYSLQFFFQRFCSLRNLKLIWNFEIMKNTLWTRWVRETILQSILQQQSSNHKLQFQTPSQPREHMLWYLEIRKMLFQFH